MKHWLRGKGGFRGVQGINIYYSTETFKSRDNFHSLITPPVVVLDFRDLSCTSLSDHLILKNDLGYVRIEIEQTF